MRNLVRSGKVFRIIRIIKEYRSLSAFPLIKALFIRKPYSLILHHWCRKAG